MTGFKDHFSHDPAAYASHRPVYPDALFAWLALQVDRHEAAWDCATGSGQAARGLAGHFRRVIASDASAAQVASASPHPSVEYRVAPAEASGLPCASIDLVSVAQAAHWFDLPAFHAEVRRVLRPGGLLALWGYERLRIDPAVDALIEHFYSGVLGPYWPPERCWVENAYRDLPFPFAEMDAPDFSMSASWDLAGLLGYLSTWSALRRYREAVGWDPLPALRERLAEAWGSPQARKNIQWPLFFRLGRV